MKGKYSALTVAKWFLWYNDKILEEEDADLISNLKLQNGISYNDWMEIKFKIDKYFSDQLSKYEKQLKLDSQYTNSHY